MYVDRMSNFVRLCFNRIWKDDVKVQFHYNFAVHVFIFVFCLQVHPKLNQMDQDKVAHIYSDLRKESMVSPLNLSVTP